MKFIIIYEFEGGLHQKEVEAHWWKDAVGNAIDQALIPGECVVKGVVLDDVRLRTTPRGKVTTKFYA